MSSLCVCIYENLNQVAIDVEDIDNTIAQMNAVSKFTIQGVHLRSYTSGNLVHSRLLCMYSLRYKSSSFTRNNNITRVTVVCVVYSRDGHSRNDVEVLSILKIIILKNIGFIHC